MTPADVLDAAADLIEKNGRSLGWWPESWSIEHCPMSAIREVDDGDVYLNAAAHAALRQEVRRPVGDWSDLERDDAVVLATMRRVAAQLREAGK